MSFLSDEKLEEEALSLRRKFGLGADQPITADFLISKIDVAFPGLRLIAVADEEMSRAAAEADPAENKIRFRQTAYNRLKSGCVWALEVLCHELSHFQLKHTGVRYRMIGHNHSRHAVNDEPQAHLLARAFLAPAQAASGKAPAALAAAFNMQPASATKRQRIIERLQRRSEKQERQLPQGVVDFLREARARGHKVTSID